MKKLLVIAAIQCGAVAAGYALGRGTVGDHAAAAGLIHLLLVFAYSLLVIGAVERWPAVNAMRKARRLSAAALVWAVTVIGWEVVALDSRWPYIYADRPADLYFAAGCLFPVLVLVGPLVRARAWWSVGGTALFAIAFVALLTHNALNRGSTAVGFIVTIRD